MKFKIYCVRTTIKDERDNLTNGKLKVAREDPRLTAWVVRSYVAPVKSASAGTSRPECARENQWIQRPSRPQGQPTVDLDQEKISTSCGESGGPAFGRCVCESYAPTRPPGLRSSRLPSTGYSGDAIYVRNVRETLIPDTERQGRTIQIPFMCDVLFVFTEREHSSRQAVRAFIGYLLRDPLPRSQREAIVHPSPKINKKVAIKQFDQTRNETESSRPYDGDKENQVFVQAPTGSIISPEVLDITIHVLKKRTQLWYYEQQWARSDCDKAKIFAEHLYGVFGTPDRQITEVEENLLLQESPPPCQEAQIKSAKVREVQNLIRKLKARKSPGYDGITAKALIELPAKAVRFLTILINACFRLKYFPSQWKVAQIILIPKPGKPVELPTSYRPISLLPICAKLCEQIISSRIKPILQERKAIPDHQFGFREQHSTIEQVNRLVADVRRAFEKKHYCSAVFLDVAQAFDKVWQAGLVHKIKLSLPTGHYKLLKSYLENRAFQVKVNNEVTDLYEIRAGVPQGSVLGPILYSLYTADIPTSHAITTATYADDTALISSDPNPEIASIRLQSHLSVVEKWFKEWRIKVNETKSIHITFTLRRDSCPSVLMNGFAIPQADSVKYLGLHLDRRLTWRTHIWSKRKQLDQKTQADVLVTGRGSALSLENGLLLYKSLLKPIWTYGIQLWGAASRTNIDIIERFQSKVLRSLVNAPWFVTNEAIRNDLKLPTVREEIQKLSAKYKDRLGLHPTPTPWQRNLVVSLLKAQG
ncbi:unnamed protein product [Trichogramma brassicae]|uniref:Reverse transcriptase domain-containing protein n=1 Tax=Trichogramma brassicae TaxID=86971 RepID=A0A6H5INU2_9HYME|nr:unnamed protein product [Trichogramma brassicae]